MEFHHFYFKMGAQPGLANTTIASPHIRLIGDAVAIISYTRLNQRVGANGAPVTRASEETRVWEKKDGKWKHVHFHRSNPTAT